MNQAFTAGQKVALFENVGEFVAFKNDRMAVVRFTGKTIDGRFGNMKGGCDCLISNLQPLTRNYTAKKSARTNLEQ